MRINAISNSNYAQNNKKQNFNGLYFKEKTIRTIAQCSMDEIKILKDAAADKINLKTLLGISDFSNPVVEHLFLRLGDSANDLKLLYEPHIDYRSYTNNGQNSFYYALGGRFEILGYAPPLPKDSDCVFETNGFCLDLGKKIPKLNVVLDEDNTSYFEVYAACLSPCDVQHVYKVIKDNGMIPNPACPIPTKEFVQAIVKKVYNYLINENMAKMTDAEKAKLAEETKTLRQKYASEQLDDFVYTV